MNCPHCQSENESSANFCFNCGKKLRVPSRKDTLNLLQNVAKEGFEKVQGNPVYAVNRGPFLAGFLSLLILGLGQVYNRDYLKALFMWLLALILGYMSGGYLVIPIIVWSIIDARRVASRRYRLWKWW